MMLAPDKVQQLQAFLGKLPPSTAARLAKAVEVDRLSDGTALPHDLILDGLRPVLRHASPSRTLTPTRTFCRPFEDLLTSRPRKAKARGRIARDTIAPLWDWLGEELVPEAMTRFVEGVKDAVLGFHYEVAMSCAAEFWPLAAEAIQAALADEATRKAARHTLGSDAALADVEEIALLLSVGTEALEIQALLEKPLASLSDDMLWSLREIYDRVLDKAPDAGPFVAVIAMGRLTRPWEALKLPVFIARKTGDTLISSTDMGLVGDVILDEMDAYLAEIRAARQPDFDPEALANAVASFAELSMGVVKEVEMRRDGKWGQHLLKARAAVAEVLEAFMERAPREILAALPTHRASFRGGPRAPDLSKRPDLEKRERAMRYASLIVGCAPFAPAASFGAALKEAQDEITGMLAAYSEDILREIRANEGEKREWAQSYFDLAAALTSLLLSPEEGELLRRRGRNAITQAAA